MSTSQNRDHGQVPSSITTPDVVQSKIGRLEFSDGYPTAETATRLRDEMNYLHGVQAFMNSIQGVSLWALRKGFAEVGIADNEFILFSELMDSTSLFLTANADIEVSELEMRRILARQAMDTMTTSVSAALLTRPASAPQAFHLLAKPTGTICNLDCAYWSSAST